MGPLWDRYESCFAFVLFYCINYIKHFEKNDHSICYSIHPINIKKHFFVTGVFKSPGFYDIPIEPVNYIEDKLKIIEKYLNRNNIDKAEILIPIKNKNIKYKSKHIKLSFVTNFKELLDAIGFSLLR